MRKLGALLVAGLLASALAAGAAGAATAGGGEVLHMTPGCNVGWDDESADIHVGAIDSSCDIVNVRTPDGGYRLILRGQIPADWMDEFIADGSPRTFSPGCLVNFGFLLQSGTWEPLLLTASVRHFTPDGRMTEVCSPYRPD